MTNSKRFVVLEIQDQVDVIRDYLESIALNNPVMEIKTLNRRDCANILYFTIRDLVDGLLAHKNGNPDNVEMICSIMFGITKNKVNKQHHEYYKALTSHSIWHGILFTFTKQLQISIKQGDWTDWTVVKVGSLIGLAEGEDHRITEFHREDKALDEESEAVITLNCMNPINYLYNVFSKQYGSNFAKLRQTMMDPDVKIDPFYRRVLDRFIADPTEYIVGLFLDTLVYIHPQMELGEHAIRRNTFIDRALDIHDISSFQKNTVSKVIMAFGLHWFSHEVKKDENYTVEYYTASHVVAVFKKQFTTHTEKYEAELLNAFKRGDYLPPEERTIAERLFIERSSEVLSLAS